MTLENLNQKIITSIKGIYNKKISNNCFQIMKTRQDFEGDFTLVVFPFLSFSGKDLESTAHEIGVVLEKFDEISTFNVIKGFLNFKLSDEFLSSLIKKAYEDKNFGFIYPNQDSPTTLIEFSSPNTNKPLHLGHIRNNLLGHAMSNIFKACGHNVKMVQIINDRGILLRTNITLVV